MEGGGGAGSEGKRSGLGFAFPAVAFAVIILNVLYIQPGPSGLMVECQPINQLQA